MIIKKGVSWKGSDHVLYSIQTHLIQIPDLNSRLLSVSNIAVDKKKKGGQVEIVARFQIQFKRPWPWVQN